MNSFSPYAAIKIRDFRLLLTARLFVTLAVQIQGMAVGWQMYALTQNPLYLGLIGLSEAVPALGVALYAGHVADIVDRRRIALSVVCTLSFCIGSLGLATFFVSDHSVLVPMIFGLVALSGLARGFYAPAVFGMISDIIPRELYGNAAAWNSTTWQACAVLGPMFGGFFYLMFGPAKTYMIATALVMTAIVCFTRVKAGSNLNKEDRPPVVENIKEGLRFVFSNQIILGAMATDLFAVLFGGAVALLPIFAKEVFNMGPQALGIMRAAPSVGAFLTATYMTHHPITKNAGRIFLGAISGFGLCMIGFGLSRNFYVSLVLLAISGMLDGISVYTRSTIYQILTPNDMKGRVAAVNSMFIGSSNEIGEFESGVTAKLMGLVPSVVFGGCMTLLVVIITAIKAPRLRQLDMDELYDEPTTA